MKNRPLDPEVFNACFPVLAIAIYKAGCKLIRDNLLQSSPSPTERIGRSKIEFLSTRSLSKLAFTVFNTNVTFRSIVTLTYGVNFPIDGVQTRKDRNKFLTAMKRWFPELSYLWVLEFQERDAPHFHILLDRAVGGQKEREGMARIWSRIAEREDLQYTSLRDLKARMSRGAVYAVHEHSKAWENIRKRDGAKRYIAKYALKPRQKIVPTEYGNCGRFWGASRDVKPVRRQTIDVTGNAEAAAFVAKMMGRPEIAAWDILPKLIIRHQADEKGPARALEAEQG